MKLKPLHVRKSSELGPIDRGLTGSPLIDPKQPCFTVSDAIWWEMWGRMGIHFVLNY